MKIFNCSPAFGSSGVSRAEPVVERGLGCVFVCARSCVSFFLMGLSAPAVACSNGGRMRGIKEKK